MTLRISQTTLLLTILLIGLLPFKTLAQPYQQHSQIEQAVKTYVQQQIETLDGADSEISLNRLDNRLKLAQCEEPLEIFTLTKFNPAGRNNIGVRCHAPRFWKIFVPVNIKFYSNVVVAAHPLSRGTTLSKTNLLLDRRQITNHQGGYFTSLDKVIGRETNRPVRLGAIIQENATTTAKIIKKGQVVTLRSGSKHFQVITSGKALSDGALGDIIKVSNSKSQRLVEGTVVAPGIVEIHN